MSCWRVSDLKFLLRKTSCVTAGALDPHDWDALRVTHLEIRREHTPPDKHLRDYTHSWCRGFSANVQLCDIIAWYDLMVFVHGCPEDEVILVSYHKVQHISPYSIRERLLRVFTLTQLVDSQWWPYLTLQDSWHHDETWCGWLCLHNRFTVQEISSSITQQLDTVDWFNWTSAIPRVLTNTGTFISNYSTLLSW